MANFAVLILAAFAFQATSAAASVGGLALHGYQGVSFGDYYSKPGYGYGSGYGSGYGYGHFDKYQGYPTHGQDFKHFEVQIQTLIRDLYQAFQTVSFDDVTAKQAFVHLIHEYVQHLEIIVEKLHQYVNYKTESDVYVFQQVAQNLKQYVWALQQFHAGEYSSVEMSTQFYQYVQKIAHEFEKLIVGFEYTPGTFYNFVQDILYQYLSATHYLYKTVENIHEYPQYGYSGPYSSQYYGGEYLGKHLGGKYYGQQYGLGTYGQQYGFDKYSHGLTGLGHYGQGYGLGHFGQGYGLGHYSQGYGYGYPSHYGYQSYGHYWPSTQYGIHSTY